MLNHESQVKRLGELLKGQSGTIVSVGSGELLTDHGVDAITKRLLNLGFIEGSHIEVLHEAPLGGDPIAVMVSGAIVALRRHEANYISVASSREG